MPIANDILLFAPKEMQPTLLNLVGDKVDFEMGKKRLLEGGWMPRGGGRGIPRGNAVLEFPDRTPRLTPTQKAASARYAAERGMTPEWEAEMRAFKNKNMSTSPSAKDTAQSSFDTRDLRLPLKTKMAAEEKTLTSLRKSNEAWANKWSAFAHKSGYDVNKTLSLIREFGSKTANVPNDASIKWFLAQMKQLGEL